MSSDWIIQTLESGNTYSATESFYRPNQDLETTRVSNLQIIKLVDGTEGYVQPETKYFKDVLSMFFASTTSAFRTQIQDYISNGDKIKITTHTGEIFYGFFIDIKRVWFVGIDNTYDIMVTFKETLS